jgi:hypothetical protein
MLTAALAARAATDGLEVTEDIKGNRIHSPFGSRHRITERNQDHGMARGGELCPVLMSLGSSYDMLA